MQILQIDPTDEKLVNAFVRFPFDLYKKSKLWVPPLINSVKAQLNPEIHPYYQHSEAAFFLATNAQGKTIGRIGITNNQQYNRYHNSHVGAFTHFDLIDDRQVASALFDTVTRWCRERKLTTLMGPKGLMGSETNGVLVEGFEHLPALGVPYNYPYYQTHIEGLGFTKERDSLSGYIYYPDWEMPDRVISISRRIMERRGYWIRKFESKEELREIVPEFIEVHRNAFESGYAFYPHTDAEYDYIAEELLAISDYRLLKIVMHEEKMIGFLIAYPDFSKGLQRARGKLMPFGWIPILLERRRTRTLNVNGLAIIPEYQGLGANAVMYQALYETAKNGKFLHVDTVFVGEENIASQGDNLALGVTWRKRHRLYQKAI